MGFREAIGISTALVIAYIGLNIYVLSVGGQKILANPALLNNWQLQLNSQYLNPLAMVAAAAVFPKLALGLSGFETGVSVMPLVRGPKAMILFNPKRA